MEKGVRVIAIIIFILISVSITLSACNFGGITANALDIPTNLRVENDIFRWNSVNNTNGYVISISGTTYECNNNSYNLTTIALSAGTYQLSVKAKGSSTYKDSDWSDSISYTVDSGILYSGNTFTNANTMFVPSARYAEPVAPSTDSVPPIIDSYYNEEDSRNYYLLDAGYIESVYISTLAKIEYTGVPINFSKTTTTSTQITNSLTKSIQESQSFSRQDSTKLGIGFKEEGEVGMPGLAKAKFTAIQEFSWTWTGTNSSSNTKSTSNTTTSANSYAEAQTISYTFGANSASIGFYRYSIYGTIDVYYILSTSSNNNTIYSWDVVACARVNDFFVRSEYSENGKFDNTANGEIIFDYDFYKNLEKPTSTKTFTPPNPTVTPGGPYYVTMTRQNAKDGNGYNTMKQEPSTNWKNVHDDFDMGQLIISNTYKNSDGSYSVVTGLKPEIGFNLQQDINALPNNPSNGLSRIHDDTYSGIVYGIAYLNNKRIGYGAYNYVIKYSDGTTTDFGGTDFFKNKSKESTISIIQSDGVEDKSITEIRIYLIYEIYRGGPGFLGIWWHEYTNWVCSTTITFK